MSKEDEFPSWDTYRKNAEIEGRVLLVVAACGISLLVALGYYLSTT
jgi:hypothetical protein